MYKVRSLSAMVLAMAMLFGAAAFAQGPARDGRGRGGGGRDGGLPIRALNLTAEQQQQVRAIRDAHQAALRQAQEAYRKAAEAQRLAIQTVPANEGQVRAATMAMAEAQADLAVEESRLFTEVWAVLTPEQQTRFKALQQERGSGRRGGRGAV
jgi:protein CpxP